MPSLSIACSLYLQEKLFAVEECSYYDNHLDTLSVQSKPKDSETLESGCRNLNRLLLGGNPSQLSCVLCAASETLLTFVDLKRTELDGPVLTVEKPPNT